ncbi:hypothetical protein AVEN_39339-1 [Araneus ventricosus]|uniref:Uncharacterized protein n=1 Tax=Araneus ventricosus TaxID=182803 RepID=A0A4Y2PVK8_ARAVE|nr:hypothetical protein AVEN_39339-1 [Araneus ventricosus]
MILTAFSVTSSPAFQLALQTELQVIPRRNSHSKDVPRRILPPCIYSVPDRVRRHIEISGGIWISAPNRDIEKIIAFSGIFDLSPCHQNGRQGQGSRTSRCQHSILTPVKLSSQP